MDTANWIRISLVLAGGALVCTGLVVACNGGVHDTAPDTGETGGGEDTGNHCVDDTGDTTVDTSPPDTGQPPDDTGDPCPDGMVAVSDTLCMDRWEASRSDATSSSPGTDSSAATSRYGVIPWLVGDETVAGNACTAAGKRLCTTTEWIAACRGPEEHAYAYGDVYEAEICNGIDADCNCESGKTACECIDGHGYPGCYRDCGGVLRVRATGSYSDCTGGNGVWDLSGNLWEYTLDGPEGVLKGGAYNCGDSVSNQRCDFVPDWNPSARGFRCCLALGPPARTCPDLERERAAERLK